MLRLACQGVIFTNIELVKYLVEKTHTKTGLSVVANVLDKVYKIGRKVADNFKQTMQITFNTCQNGTIEPYLKLSNSSSYLFLSP